jgi:hypothetical protein
MTTSAVPPYELDIQYLGEFFTEAADLANERRIELTITRNMYGDWIACFALKDGHGPFQVNVTVRQPLKNWRAVMNAAIAKAREQRVKSFGPDDFGVLAQNS